LDSLPGEAWLAVPLMERRPPKENKWAALLRGTVSYGVGQTTPPEVLPTLGGRGHGVWLCSGGRLGWSSPRWNAGPKNKMGSALAWARFLMGLGKQRRERRSRHLGVVSLAVGCAPGWGIVFIPSMERRADTMGSASTWAHLHGFWPPMPQTAGRTDAVAELLLQPSPPSRSPCHHVAVAPSRSRYHRALAGDRHAYAPCAVPRCLIGLVGRP